MCDSQNRASRQQWTWHGIERRVRFLATGMGAGAATMRCEAKRVEVMCSGAKHSNTGVVRAQSIQTRQRMLRSIHTARRDQSAIQFDEYAVGFFSGGRNNNARRPSETHGTSGLVAVVLDKAKAERMDGYAVNNNGLGTQRKRRE
jgi:hypothetical protein